MQRFIRKPSVVMYAGIRVDRDTDIDYKDENVEQTIKDLVLHSVTKVSGEGFESVYDTTITLTEGDVLIFDEKRGYIKPVEPFVSVTEAIDELTCIKDLR